MKKRKKTMSMALLLANHRALSEASILAPNDLWPPHGLALIQCSGGQRNTSCCRRQQGDWERGGGEGTAGVCVCVLGLVFFAWRETCPETVADFAVATRLFVLNYFCTCTLHFTQAHTCLHTHTHRHTHTLSPTRTDNCTYLFAFQFWFSAFAFVHCKAKCYSTNPNRLTPPSPSLPPSAPYVPQQTNCA